MSIWTELKRRNVTRVAAAYLVTAWLLVQAADVLAPALHLPSWIESAVVFVLILGFPIALVFAWAYEFTPEGLKRESEVDRSRSITRMTGRKLDFFIIGLLGVALILFAFDKFVIAPQRAAELVATTTETVKREVEAAAEEIDKSSIAVLAFQNMSADPDQEYFADGLSEELLNVLARLHGLRVAARTSSFSYKGKDVTTGEIARELKVAHVLEGSVRKSGDQIRITAQLIDASEGFHLWSETYDRKLTEIFDIQDEIARAITHALRPHLGLASEQSAPPSVIEAANPAAFEAYLKGRQLINKRGPSNIEAAVRALKRSLQLDSNYAPAHAQLAIATALLLAGPESYGNLTLAQVRAQALPHIERAFELSPDLAEAHGAMALLNLDQDPRLTIEHGEKALAANPSYSDVMNWLALAYSKMRMHTAMLQIAQTLYERDPRSVVGRIQYVSHLGKSGRFAEARRLGGELAEDEPWAGFVALAGIALLQGDLSHAIEKGLRARAVESEQFSNTFLTMTFGWTGLHEEALRADTSVAFEAAWHSGRYADALEVARRMLAADPDNGALKMKLLNALYFNNELSEARTLGEALLAETAAPVIYDSFIDSLLPNVAIVHARQQAGDQSGADALIERLEADLARSRAAGLTDHRLGEGEAIVAALRNDAQAAAAALRRSIAGGLRDPTVFNAPLFAAIADVPEVRAVRSELDARLKEQQSAVLALICRNNPVPDSWRPLQRTCEGL